MFHCIVALIRYRDVLKREAHGDAVARWLDFYEFAGKKRWKGRNRERDKSERKRLIK